MGIPFRNGYELAKFFGYGELYSAAKKKEDENVDMLESVKGLIARVCDLLDIFADLHLRNNSTVCQLK